MEVLRKFYNCLLSRKFRNSNRFLDTFKKFGLKIRKRWSNLWTFFWKIIQIRIFIPNSSFNFYFQLNTSQIIVSKSDNFYLEILQKTSGKGVDVVFVTLPNSTLKFQSYVSSLAENGKCIYINKGRLTKEEILGKIQSFVRPSHDKFTLKII